MSEDQDLALWRVDLGDPALSLSPVLAETMVSGPAPAACDHRPTRALIRRQRPYALLGPRDRHLPRLGEGIDFLARRGLPTYMRVGGGSLVVLDEDCLSFALAWPCRSPAHVGQTVRAMGEPVIAALSRLGIEAHMGSAHGSYCEGPSDLVAADGRKVAGMAVSLRGGWALLSGMLLVRQDPRYATGVVAGFEAVSGGGRAFRWQAVTNLESALGAPVTVEGAGDALEAALARWGAAGGRALAHRSIDATTKQTAAALLARRRLMPQAAAQGRA